MVFAENPFLFFALEPKLTLDGSLLEKKVRLASKQIYLDHTGNERAARLVSLNQAYLSLKDPLQRAERLFALRGISPKETHVKLSDVFLNDILDEREVLDTAREKRDQKQLEALKVKMEDRFNHSYKALAVLLDDPRSTREDCFTVLVELGKLRFFSRFLDEVNHMLEELYAP